MALSSECTAVPELYDYLWRDKTPKQEEMSHYGRLRISVPDTVVYMFSKAQSWYFTNGNGKVMKRSQLNSKRILDKMTPCGPCAIAAFAVPSASDDSPVNGSGRNDDSGSGGGGGIQYYDDDRLADALTRDGLPDHAILQQFVVPKPLVKGQTRNRVLQSVWQPHHFMCERLENLHLLTDRRWSPRDRAETVEGLRHSCAYPLKSPALLGRIRELCNGIAEHLYYVADLVTRSMRINWKVDQNHAIQLLWCSHLDAVDRSSLGGGGGGGTAAAAASRERERVRMLPANPRLYLAHRRSAKRAGLRREKERREREEVMPWGPEVGVGVGEGGRGGEGTNEKKKKKKRGEGKEADEEEEEEEEEVVGVGDEGEDNNGCLNGERGEVDGGAAAGDGVVGRGGGGGGGVGGGVGGVYRPPASALMHDDTWGAAFPLAKRKMLAPLPVTPYSVPPRERRRRRRGSGGGGGDGGGGGRSGGV